MRELIGIITKKPEVKYNLTNLIKNNSFNKPDSTCVKIIEQHSPKQDIIWGTNEWNIQSEELKLKQPIYNSKYMIMFDGQIYDHLSLRQYTKSYTYTTNSTVETVLALYDTIGISFLKYLNGVYSLCIFDIVNDKVILARDPIGVKSLFVYEGNDCICFSNNINQIVKSISDIDLTINKLFMVKNILLDPFVAYDNTTAFSKINGVAPGCAYIIDTKTWKKISHKYYNLGKEKTTYKTADLYHLFENSINQNINTSSKIGCSISGGFDSSLIATFLSGKVDNIKYFSISSDNCHTDTAFGSDIYYSKNIYKYLNINSQQMNIISNNLSWTLQIIDDLVRCLGAPLFDERTLVLFNLYNCAKRSTITDYFSGQGADEIWYGYYPQIWEWFSVLYHSKLTRDNIVDYFKKETKKSVIKKAVSLEEEQKLDLYNDISTEILKIDSDDDNKKLSLYMMSTVLPSLLYYENQLSMSNLVNLHVPFIDIKMVDLAFSLNSSEHIVLSSQGKGILKETFKDKLPKEIIYRKKSPLPKSNADSRIETIFISNLKEITNCPLIQELFSIEQIGNVIYQPNNAFYGGTKEAMLQIISMWRFYKLYYGK